MYTATGYFRLGDRQYTPGEVVREEISREKAEFLKRANVLRENAENPDIEEAPKKKERKAKKAETAEREPETAEAEEVTEADEAGTGEAEEEAIAPELDASEMVTTKKKGGSRK